MTEPIAALIVRILADTSELVTGVKNVAGQLDTFENRVAKFGKALAGYFTVQAVAGFAQQIIAEADAIDQAAKRVGAGVVEYQKFSFALKQTAGDSADAAQAIARLNERVGSSDAGLLNALRKLNISFDEFRQKDPIQRYIELGIAINSIQDPAERAARAVEALGEKGEKSLAGINQSFKDLADEAPVYTERQVQALDRLGDSFDRLWAQVKAGAAETIVAIMDIGKAADEQARRRTREFAVRKSGGMLDQADVYDELPDPMNPGLPKPPTRSGQLPPSIAPGGVNPDDANAMGVALADLALKYEQVRAKERELEDQRKAGVWVWQQLSGEIKNLAAAMQPLLDKFETGTKVDQFTRRIITLAERSAELRREQERLLELIAPGTSEFTGSDDVERDIFKLRSDPRNFDRSGNLTPQALDIEARLIDIANLRLVASQLQPTRPPTVPVVGAVVPGGVTPGPMQITINAQGSWWDSPDRLNQLGRLVEDSIARRSGLTNTYTRR